MLDFEVHVFVDVSNDAARGPADDAPAHCFGNFSALQQHFLKDVAHSFVTDSAVI